MPYKFNPISGHFDIVSTEINYPFEINSTATASGTELITNGTFTGSSTGWTISGNEWVYSSNHMEYTFNEQYDSLLSSDFATDASKTYILTFTVSGCSAGAYVTATFTQNTLQYNQYWGYAPYGDGTHSVIVKTDYTGSAESICFTTFTYVVGDHFHLDNVSLKETTDYNTALTVVGFVGDTLMELGGNNQFYGNTSFGMKAHQNSTTGTSNCAFGYKALEKATTAGYNVALGGYVLSSLVSGTYNVGLGYNALNLATGDYNLAMGANCLQALTTGSYNVAIGRSAEQCLTTGQYNVAIGGDAMLCHTTESYNVAIGHQAVYTGVGAKNVVIGYHAGYNIGSGGSSCNAVDNSILIGYDVRTGADAETNEIVIGYGAVGNGSNTTTIGNSSTTATYLKGNLAKLAGYNGIAGVANVIPAEYAQVSLATQGAAIGTTTLYAVPASGIGMYRISYYAKVTRAATTSSTLGALTIGWTDPDAIALTLASATDAGNTTSSFIQGEMIVYAKASTNITYTMAYASSGATSMQFRLQIRVEALG